MEKDPHLAELLSRLSCCAVASFGHQLVGAYLHGSAAMGCFQWQISDVDCLIVVDTALTEAQKLHFIRACLELCPLCPPKGLELSVVTRAVCARPQQESPFELHFSPMYAAAYARDAELQLCRMPDTDPDLAAHFAMTRSRGRTLLGPPADEIFAPIPREWMLGSLENDLADAKDGMMGQPVYYVLNYCRALAFLEQGELLSKEEGGIWGMENLPDAYGTLIRDALAAYREGTLLCAEDYPVCDFVREMSERWRQGRGQGVSLV